MLKGKTVVLAVTGGIAAYKIPNLASMLKKLGADVQVLMTKNATNFITPITFESLTGTKCMVDTFDRNFQFSVEHVALAKRADVVLVAPDEEYTVNPDEFAGKSHNTPYAGLRLAGRVRATVKQGVLTYQM